ncbi:DUF2971 domain-containing protein [Klebsiella pneumoniae]|uniref:DUF2971 domain-containing protein n=1 Tax=Klebsiella pneumoniae TaxID=573 RepID=UPI00300E1848
MQTPKKLFKYKKFNDDCMELIIDDYLYFANPAQFNDPLDCKVSILDDVNDEGFLRDTLSTLLQRNSEKKLKASAKNLRYKGPVTAEKISILSQSEAEKIISDIYSEFSFVQYDFNIQTINQVLTSAIGNIILSGYSRGVLSLSKKDTCPLMWAHYADNHKGLCLGYSIPENTDNKIRPVSYTSEFREIKISQIRRMLDGDENAKAEIEHNIFLRKAKPWGYEDEWRMVSDVGLQNSSIYLSEITFGLRCKYTTIFSVMMSLSERQTPVEFYKIIEVPHKFTLEKERIAFDHERLQGLPRCMESLDQMLNDEE